MKPELPYNEKPKVCVDANLAANMVVVLWFVAFTGVAILLNKYL
jgi:hypothetical protein